MLDLTRKKQGGKEGARFPKLYGVRLRREERWGWVEARWASFSPSEAEPEDYFRSDEKQRMF
ncbi:hypothetical protein BO86DRAFT_391698 [Aspergillus japonicus CBS 114.51]|uniref:Uncharacterized protein n=1 Tax=Aspergillus japonicus CBS 114.51 TaxID=1448312 RepID=A0A8T8WS14_ASPJA|nr:hypothetical protein BO86DRAFT_391698 [Aspergillus japonicus CBS 114.51]RAH78581.1 hypothetical protein BO86DRAFT_391698 [Aspergillus japonicus CBS 114.51]